MTEAGIFRRLTADAAVNALAGTRVYPLVLPDEGPMPAITYQRISPGRSYTTTGRVELARIRLQIDCWAEEYSQVKALFAGVLASLECFRGTLPEGTYVDTIQLDSASDLYDSVSRLYRVTSDFFVFAAE